MYGQIISSALPVADQYGPQSDKTQLPSCFSKRRTAPPFLSGATKYTPAADSDLHMYVLRSFQLYLTAAPKVDLRRVFSLPGMEFHPPGALVCAAGQGCCQVWRCLIGLGFTGAPPCLASKPLRAWDCSNKLPFVPQIRCLLVYVILHICCKVYQTNTVKHYFLKGNPYNCILFLFLCKRLPIENSFF